VQAAGRFARQRDRPFVHEVRVEARFNLPCCFRIGEHRRATSLSFDAAYAPGASAAIGATLNNTSDIEHQDCQTGTAFGISVRLMRRPASLEGAGFGPRASGARKKRIEALSPDPFSLPSSCFFPDPDSRIPKPIFTGHFDTDQGRW